MQSNALAEFSRVDAHSNLVRNDGALNELIKKARWKFAVSSPKNKLVPVW